MSDAWRGVVLEGLAAVAAAAWLAYRPPVAEGDPFLLSLVILPLVIFALRSLDRWAHQLGGRSVRPATARFEGPLLIALVLLTITRHRLGLTVTDWFLAAAYLGLLAHRVTRLVIGWRPCLGRRLPRRPPAVFLLLPLVCYLALQPWTSAQRQPDGDEPFYLLLTHSLAYDFDARLSNNYADEDWRSFMSREIEPQPGDPVGLDGEVLSRHTLLLPMFLTPAYRLAGRWGAMAMMALMAALTAWMVLRLGRYYAPHQPGAALLAYSVFAFSPPLLLYSYQIWIEVPAALLLTIALDRILALRYRRRWKPAQLATLVVALTLLPLLKLRLGLLAIPLVFLAWLRARPGRRSMALVGGGFLATLGGLFLYNRARFGNPLKMHSWSELGAFSQSPVDFVKGAVGMFYDAAFGLFLPAPIWLLLLPSLWLAVRRRHPLPLDFAVIALPYLVMIWPRSEWYGGWSPPFRYPLVLLPLLALLLIPILGVRSRGGVRILSTTLGVATLILAVLWVVMPGWTFNFADGKTLMLDQASARFGADLARFFPSTVRPRLATWVWPVVSLLTIPLALGLKRRIRYAPLWGISGLLLFGAGLGWAAVNVPTRVVELEDEQVIKHLGRLAPSKWVVNRPSYRCGWAVPIGGRITAPVVAGGSRVTLRMEARFVGSRGTRELDVQAGDRLLESVRVGRMWKTYELGPFDWNVGEPLVIVGSLKIPESDPQASDGPPRVDPTIRTIVDRVELTWHD